MGSAGIGSISHLTYLLFGSLMKTEIQHVPYRGLSQAADDLIGGQIDSLFDQIISVTPHIVSGSVKPIVVTAPTRAPSSPKVPSSSEAGAPDLQTLAWTARLAGLGADLPPPVRRTPQVLADLVRSEVANGCRSFAPPA